MLLSFSAYGRELLREASEAETSGEYLLLLFLPSSFPAVFFPLKTHQIVISRLLLRLPLFLPSLQVDGVSYLLQEIYGIENKYNSQESKVNISLAAQ